MKCTNTQTGPGSSKTSMMASLNSVLYFPPPRHSTSTVARQISAEEWSVMHWQGCLCVNISCFPVQPRFQPYHLMIYRQATVRLLWTSRQRCVPYLHSQNIYSWAIFRY